MAYENQKSPTASVVVPAYNVAKTIKATLDSLLAQTMTDIEIIVVDDGSKDETCTLVEAYTDPRLRLIRQANRGLAGAHNTGIHKARGRYIGFCDADDLWLPEKLERHVEHLEQNPDIGISFSGSKLIDEQGKILGVNQTPKLKNITPAYIFKRNPIGNGSSAVIRREALEGFAYRPMQEKDRDWWFDETFRQSDDIEGWLRFALTQDWRIEGINGHLTLYRIHGNTLSANTSAQLESWIRMKNRMAEISPSLVKKHGPAALAYQHRYLCRRAVSMRDGTNAWRHACKFLSTSWRPLWEEPLKTATTVFAAIILKNAGSGFYAFIERQALTTPRP